MFLEIKNFEDQLVDLINNSNLNLAIVYFILKEKTSSLKTLFDTKCWEEEVSKTTKEEVHDINA